MRSICCSLRVATLLVGAAILVAGCNGGDGSNAQQLAIKNHPADASVVLGDAVRFGVDAVGAGKLTYQWRRDGISLAGATDKVYTLSRANEADEGASFSVLVSDERSTVASASARLKVTATAVPPSIVVQPANQSVYDGEVATFSVTADGTAPLRYQWRRDGTVIAGASKSTLSFKATLADSGAIFRVRVTNLQGSVVSAGAKLTVSVAPAAPTIVVPPANLTVTAPATATFSVSATGTAPLAYQWRWNGVNISGATSSAYTTPPTSVADSGSVFTVVVRNSLGSVTSAPATLTVVSASVPPSISTQPVDQSVAQGKAATFAVTASGTAPLTYQWRRNDVNVVGANASTYTTPATTFSADNGALYDVVITNLAGTVVSRKATLTVTRTYLQTLLDSIPEGGWVKANTNLFSDVWPTGLDLPPPVPGSPALIIPAWSGFAWDSRRSNLMLYGGGHENYVGNEVYVWQGSNGGWTRGTLPSRVDLSSQLVAGDGAPQSAHTYQTNSYAPVTDRFVVFGGAVWSNGGSFFDANGRTGPWWWDPSKADADRVGGQDGTGWDATRLGSNAWLTRPYVPWLGQSNNQIGLGFIYGTAAYLQESGRDVLYLTIDSESSGWPSLYRYQLGTPTTADLFQRVGAPSYLSLMYSGASAIDTRKGLFVRTALAQLTEPYPAPGDLAVWKLANNNPANPDLNIDVAVRLFDQNGAPVHMNFASSIAYDVVNDQFIIWDSRDRGTVWITHSAFNADGSIATNWTIQRVPSTTAAQPLGNHNDGVLGKWKYAPELSAFVGLDSPAASGDVWLYKPPSRP